LPGPRSSEEAIALSAFSYALSVASPADLLSSMMRSLSLRTRCATCSSRASAAPAADFAALCAWDAADEAEDDDRVLRLRDAVERARVLPPERVPPLERVLPPERVPPERELAVEPEPLERLPPDRVEPLERVLRDDELRDDEPLVERRVPPLRDDEPEPELEPLLLAWGNFSSLH
jgi:hypothetical protein